MFREFRSRFDEALRRTLGVDIDTAQQIVAQHGDEGLLNAWLWGPFGQMKLVSSETLRGQVERYTAQGATSITVTVFDRETAQTDGGEVPQTNMPTRYSIW